MTTVATTALESSLGWLAACFAGTSPVRRWHGDASAELATAAHAASAQLAVEFTEERARAATSGFEMGEYEPLARRN